VALHGAWRIYSSGPGIALALVIAPLLGLRLEQESRLIDPVMLQLLDGFTVQLTLADLCLELTYRAGPRGNGFEQSLDETGRELEGKRRPHAYRIGALAWPRPAPGSVKRWTVDLGQAMRNGIVTGPSLTRWTCMSAPNSPFATTGCCWRANISVCS
jgi:1,2-beta-oligoglucan phosphorylase